MISVKRTKAALSCRKSGFCIVIANSSCALKHCSWILDRIVRLDFDFNLPYLEETFDSEQFYKDIIGVTVNQGLTARDIEIWVDRENAPYVITKPFHRSQQLVQTNEDGSVVIRLKLKINYELERLLIGFAEGIEVLKPEGLRNRIKSKLEQALSKYQAN
jgi:predicted DNA-binding transcriptional regulator YafY